MEIRRGVVGVARIDFKVLGSCSLKEKRSTVKSFLGKSRSRFPVSIAETGYQEEWGLASVTAALVSARPEGASNLLRELVEFLEENYPVEVLRVVEEIMEGQ